MIQIVTLSNALKSKQIYTYATHNINVYKKYYIEHRKEPIHTQSELAQYKN